MSRPNRRLVTGNSIRFHQVGKDLEGVGGSIALAAPVLPDGYGREQQNRNKT